MPAPTHGKRARPLQTGIWVQLLQVTVYLLGICFRLKGIYAEDSKFKSNGEHFVLVIAIANLLQCHVQGEKQVFWNNQVFGVEYANNGVFQKEPLNFQVRAGLGRDPSIEIIYTLGPKVCKSCLHFAIWIPRVTGAASKQTQPCQAVNGAWLHAASRGRTNAQTKAA